MPTRDVTTTAGFRLPFVDALRAVLASTIAWHHFVLYGPLSAEVAPSVGEAFYWLRNYRWAVQAFFVVGGYVMARSMSPRTWDCRQVAGFVARRYCRLGLPYLATIALALAACSVGRGVLPESVIGPPPTWAQIAAHLAFLQDILGYPSLSAGLWFVCIDFQLGLIYVAMLYLRDATARWRGSEPGESATRPMLVVGWAMAAASLFFFNLDAAWDVWAVYYFAHFFLGVLVYHGLKGSRSQIAFGLFVLLMVAALAFRWRWRLAAALLTGVVLFASTKMGLMVRWPASRIVAYLGRTSYSLFLVHFPVLVVVETVWVRFDWASQSGARAGLATAYLVSLAVAAVFYDAVEAPAARLSHRFS